jgi:flavin-dependent thymidylate synthase
MRVLLAGLNLDVETVKELQKFIRRVAEQLSGDDFTGAKKTTRGKILQQLINEATRLLEMDNLTPETISAAYARISRDPRPVNELREIARQEVDRARKSNRNIIFGLGHSSVAEHAIFNFDIIEVSRYAVETIEHFRLASYTEKSQRYILFKDDFIIPDEIKSGPWQKEFTDMIQEQNITYNRLYEKLKPYFFEKYRDAAEDKANHRMIDGLAKEDARYVISLATETQLGMTVNARTLENMIVKCNSHPLAEIRQYGQCLFECVKDVAPSIVKYIEPTDYLLDMNNSLRHYFSSHFSDRQITGQENHDVLLLDFTEDPDDLILAATLFKYHGGSLDDALEFSRTLDETDRREFYEIIFTNINPWDSVLREFEFVNFTFQLVVSASNFGQLKRHRIANITAQNYDINLGVTIPDSIVETNQTELFMKIINKTNDVYECLKKEIPLAAPYVLTNAHRRRVLFRINLRELYHFSRLREDRHAQWDIRRTAHKMVDLIKRDFPLCASMLGGKDEFLNIYSKFLSK